jgi:hypothetical protein
MAAWIEKWNFIPARVGGNARIVDSMSGKVARPTKISPTFE